jgi:hypothetical protein
MATNSESRITDEVVDQLLAGRDPASVFESGGLVDELKKRPAERILNPKPSVQVPGLHDIQLWRS